jgi:hypothetical protein
LEEFNTVAAGTGLPSLADIRLDGVDIKSYVIALTCKKKCSKHYKYFIHEYKY